MRTPDPIPDSRPLVGWAEIAKYLDCSVATVRRWASRPRFPLPYHVTLDHPWASEAELQVWLRQNTIPGQEFDAKRARMSTDERANTEPAKKPE